MKINRKELSIENYNAPDGKLLIRPHAHMTRTVEVTDFVPKPTEDGEDPTKSDKEPEYVPVKSKSKAPFEIQIAEVVAVSPNSKFKVGDNVIYSIRFVKEFDLFKETFLMSEYDSYGTYKF